MKQPCDAWEIGRCRQDATKKGWCWNAEATANCQKTNAVCYWFTELLTGGKRKVSDWWRERDL